VRITKYGHACVRLEKDGRAVVIDPGVLTPEDEALDGVEAVLVTHEHFDHLDVERLRAAAEKDPRLTVLTCPGVAAKLEDLGDRVRVLRADEAVEVAGFEITAKGEKHHFSHPDYPPVDNIGFLVDGEVFHTGDALTVVDASTLLFAGQAPWLTVPAMIEYLRAVAPRRAYAVHDGLINEWGLRVLDDVLAMEAKRPNADIRRLMPGESVDL